ncbi:VOC family protein [Phaeodactylibacter luteus]|uniref:VOC family protein n=1 Tax=Phaeodactylibacter luteus TaxID=1564516 RepID=A0A5C6S7F9_9BACT|nr:VOC family protein [Phaeodactylibacter luteus]TXB70293.1 VOC family protein [Phaeodactylibacter luteus]
MKQHLGRIALLVDDYDHAIAYFTQKLGFDLLEDTPLSPEKRWVVVRPAGAGPGCELLLAKAKNEAQRSYIGQQGGGRVFLFLYTDNFDRDYQRYLAAGVDFEEAPRTEPYGKVAVFRDLYGNRWDFIELQQQPAGNPD